MRFLTQTKETTLFLCLLAFAGLFRALTLFTPELLKVPDPAFYITRPRDIGIIGLMSLRALTGEFPLFFYGQNFMGSLEVFLNLPLFVLLGASPYTLQVLPILISLVFIVLVYLLARKVSGPPVARLCALWLAIPPVFLMKWSIEARSHYPLTLILGTILIHLTWQLTKARDRRSASILLTAAWGLIAGLGWWTNMLIAAYLLPAGFLLWVDDRKFFFKVRFPVALGALAVGALPFLLFQGFAGWPVWGVSLSAGFFQAPRLKELLTNALPILIGFVPPVIGGGGQVLLILVPGLYAAALGFFIFRHRQGLRAVLTFRRGRITGGEWLVLLLVSNLVLSLFTGFSRWLPDHCQRYLLPLYTAAPIILFTSMQDWSRRAGRWVLMAATALLLGFQFWGNFVQDTWSILRPQEYRKYQARLAQEYELLGFLQKSGVKRIYTEDGIGKKIMLLGREPLICADPYQEVYPPYADRVDGAETVGFLFYGENLPFENTLAATGGAYRKIKINDLYTWYGEFTPPPPFRLIPRLGWTVTARPGPGASGDLLDGDLDTGWSGPQVPGSGLLVDLGRVYPVSRIFIIPFNYREVPIGFQTEVSEDGRHWRPVSRISNYWGPFFWSGPHPLIKIRRGRVELSFPEVQARYIRLTLTAGDHNRDWSLAEIYVGNTLPERQAGGPRPAPPDLLKFLQTHKVQTVYADHWLSAWLRVESDRRLRTIASNHFLGENGENDPSPEQRFPVSFDPGTAFILEPGKTLSFMEVIRSGGLVCGHRAVDPYEIYYNCRRAERPVLDPVGWQVSANVNREEVKKAVDGDLKTRWTSGKPQAPGLFFEVDLGDVLSVKGLSLALGASRRDYPRRLKVLGSRDGKSWTVIEADWSSGFHWAGNVLLKMRGERLDYFFNPSAAVRFLKLIQEGSDPRYYWSIHELTVYGDRSRG